LQVAGRRFERRLVCAACGEARPCLRLHGTRRAAARCRGCGRPMTPVAFDALERLRAEDLSAAERARTLRGLGARVGDLLRVGGSGGFRDFEIGDDQV